MNKPDVWLRHDESGVVYYTAPNIAVPHAFTTRLGGVSTGVLESLNLSVRRGDTQENVRENFRRLSEACGMDLSRMVYARQVHGTQVHLAHAAELQPSEREPLFLCDGFVTAERGVPIAVFMADCLPVLLHDPVHDVIGAVHFVAAPDGALVNVAARGGVREAVAARFGGSAEGLVRAYFAAQREMVARFDFDVVAHPDVVRKTNRAEPWFDESAPWYREELERTADAIAAAGRLVEVNTAALSHVDADVDASPSPAFRALLRARGVRFVLASDAHSAGALDRGFDRFAGCEAFVLPPCAASIPDRP